MAEEPDDRLSELPDDLLQHILQLAPSREAVTTAVLSRRWRWLWPPPTGAVKIDICRFPSHGNLLRAAEEALAASHGSVERLAIDVGQGFHSYFYVAAHVLSHPASRGVQDVRIRAEACSGLWTTTAAFNDDDYSLSLYNMNVGRGQFKFSFFSVPSAALRVLHMTNCGDDLNITTATPSSIFPCLEVLRLRRCNVTLQRLRDIVAASPHLATLQLEYVYLLTMVHGRAAQQERLCCPGVTNLVLVNCSCERRYVDFVIELDVPSVQYCKYKGKINQIKLRSPLRDVRRANLHILATNHSNVDTCKSFWRFLWNFRGAKVLKVNLDWPIDYVAAVENQSAQSIKFCVEQLEIDALYNPESKRTGVAIGNLLQCCPGLRDLRLKLNRSTSLQRKDPLEFHKSIDHFRRRRDHPVVPLCGHDGKSEVSDIPGLSDKWIQFSCLRFHLKRLSLQFHMDKDNPNCVGVQLLKFFIERGKALEEIYIHDGNMKMWEHLNCKMSQCAAKPQPISEHHVLARMSEELSTNHFSSSKISGCFHPQKLEVRRTNPWFGSRSITILPLADR